jgi:hypothetical protein
MAVIIRDRRGAQMARDVMAELTAFVGSLENWEMDLAFDPDDPTSVEAAIVAMEEAIDSRAYRIPGNDPVMDLAEQMKEQYRQIIRAQRHDDDTGEAEPE